MAFEKCKELYSALDNASDFVEHSRTEGSYNKKPIKGIRIGKGKYRYKKGKGDDSDGIDEYGAYHLSENGEKEYDLGDGIKYDYTDGYFLPRNNPDAPPKKWDDVVGDYVPVSWEREEEVYPDIGDEPQEEAKVEEEKEPESKEKPEPKEKKPNVHEIAEKGLDIKGSHDPEKAPKVKIEKKEEHKKFSDSLNELWSKVKGGASSMWEKIRNKIRHGELLDDDEYEFLAHNGIETEEDFLEMVENVDDDEFLAHHGVKDQRWGQRNGPPYPLKDHQRPIDQKGAKYYEQHKNDRLDSIIKGFSVASNLYNKGVEAFGNTPYEHSKYNMDDLDEYINVGGTKVKYADLRAKADTPGERLTEAEVNALNARKAILNKFNSNYSTREAVGRQRTMDMLQSIGGVALTGLTLLKTFRDLKSDK